MSNDSLNPEDHISVIRGKVDSLSVYEVTSYELQILERGSPQSIYLDISISLFSIAMSFFVSLVTTEITDNKIFIIFVFITIVSFFLGIILIILWAKNKKSGSEVINQIKKRIPNSEMKKLNN